MNGAAGRFAIWPGWSLLRSGLAGHFAITLVAQVAILGLGALTGVIAARLLGLQGRGELAALTLWPSTLVSLAALGMNQAIVYSTGRKRHTLSEIWTGSLVIGLGQSILVVLVGLLVVPLALRHYSSSVRNLSLLFLAASPLVILGGYPGNLLQGMLELASFNLTRTIAPLVYAGGVAALFLLQRPSLWQVVAYLILGYALAGGVGYWVVAKEVRVRFAWDVDACLDLLKYGCKTQLGNVSSYINRSADQLVLSLFVAPRELGLYVVAVTMTAALSLFPQAAGVVTLAAGSSASAIEARRVIGHSFRASLLWLVILCTVLLFLAPALIRLLFGTAFAGAATACRVLLPGTIAMALNQVLYDGARSLGEPALPSYAESFATIVTFLGLYAFIPRLGFVGAAVASTLAYTSSFIFMLVLCRSRMRIGLRELLFTTTGSVSGKDI